MAGCADVNVAVHRAGTPDATLAPGLPSVEAGVTPFALGTSLPAAEIAGLRLAALGAAGQVDPARSAVALGDLRGARATVVAFWATTCAPCAQELPALQTLEPSITAQGGRLLLVDEREDPSTVSGWLRDHGVHLATWLDPDGSVHDSVGLLGVPTTALLGPDGGVAYRIEGKADVGPLRAELAALGISAQ